MIPQGLQYSSCKQPSAIWTNSLTPSSTSTNHVLDYPVPINIERSYWFFIGEEAVERFISIPLHDFSFQGDYPATSQENDVMKHTAGMACPISTFRYQYTHREPDYSYTSYVCIGNVCFTRNLYHSISLRSDWPWAQRLSSWNVRREYYFI